MEEIFGIDLGTTYSCIAEISPITKLPSVIKNQDDLATTPSIVFFDENDAPLVGGEAKRYMSSDPSRAIAFIKREMSNPSFRMEIGSNEITPVKISAMILKKLVDDANVNRKFRGKPPIKDVVVTVPAYFGNNERELTRQAGVIAGLNVLGLLNEPTAAALYYGSKGNVLNEKTFMVYDLGGGTFDVSIMRMQNNVLETLSTDGDHHLGGVDWDAAIVDYALKVVCGESDVTYEDIKHTRDGGDMIMNAEKCKKMLSDSDRAPLRFRYKGRMYMHEMRRSTFEELTFNLLKKTMDCIRNAMKISKDPDANIDMIFLVGGSSYMPMVRERLYWEFPGTNIFLEQFEPDLAVAKGAAIQAFNIANPQSAPAAGVRIGTDLSSRSYGARCVQAGTDKVIVENLILRTDPMVYSGTCHHCTLEDNQTCVMISIYEDKSVENWVPVEDGTLVQQQLIEWGYPVPQGTPVDYTIKRGPDGIIHIEAVCEQHKVNFEIKPEGGVEPEEMERLKLELAMYNL